jgi:hypothetical protein
VESAFSRSTTGQRGFFKSFLARRMALFTLFSALLSAGHANAEYSYGLIIDAGLEFLVGLRDAILSLDHPECVSFSQLDALKNIYLQMG